MPTPYICSLVCDLLTHLIVSHTFTFVYHLFPPSERVARVCKVLTNN